MLVPQAKLLAWFAAIVLPFSALGALYPDAQLTAAVLILGFVAVAALDAALALHHRAGLALELPGLLRLSLERPASLPVTVRNPSGRPQLLRLGLGLPSAVRPAHEDLTVRLPPDLDASTVAWPITPVRRGRYTVRQAHLETPSALGLWGLRQSVPVACELRVYPNLQRERKDLAALFLHRGRLGQHAQRQIGKGRDFEKLREYIAGDSYDEIHWKATAKRGHPVTKVFQIERTQEIYIIIDASRLSARRQAAGGRGREIQGPGLSRTAGGAPAARTAEATTEGAGAIVDAPAALERFITAGLVLAQAAEQQGDLFGLVTFTGEVGTFLRAKNGHAHYAACRDALYTLEARNVSPDFDEIVAFLRTRLRRRALLVFLTSLDDPMLAEGFARNMALLARQHLVLANMIQPPEVAPLFTRGDDVATLDDIYRHLGGHLQWHRLQELQRALHHRGVRLALLPQERLATELVSQYLGIKQRQEL